MVFLRRCLVTRVTALVPLVVLATATGCSSPGFSSRGGAPASESRESHESRGSASGANTGFTTRGGSAPPPSTHSTKTAPRGSTTASPTPSTSATFQPAPSPNPLPPPPPPSP